MIQYLFIDGGYVREALSAFGAEWFGQPDLPIDYSLFQGHVGAQKVFYYDCLPPKTKDEQPADYAARIAPHEERFRKLRMLPGWHVPEGVVKRQGRRGPTQKEVDILIAVDMLTHTHRRNMERLHLIAGDQDFRPVVDAVVREGMYVHLWYERETGSQELLEAADATHMLDPYEMLSKTTPEFRHFHTLPSRWSCDGMNRDQMLGVQVAEARTAERELVRLWNWNTGGAHTTAEIETQLFNGVRFTYYRHHDEALVKKMCAYEHVLTPWTTSDLTS